MPNQTRMNNMMNELTGGMQQLGTATNPEDEFDGGVTRVGPGSGKLSPSVSEVQ